MLGLQLSAEQKRAAGEGKGGVTGVEKRSEKEEEEVGVFAAAGGGVRKREIKIGLGFWVRRKEEKDKQYLQTVVCFPFVDGDLELGTTELAIFS